MLSTNNTVTNTTQKEKKYSLSTVLAWLYLKTIGRILTERWNKWAESILYYNKIIADNGVQTDDLLNSNREKELKDENEKLQEKLKEMNELTEQVKLLGEEKEVFAKFFAEQAQQIGNLQLENEELKSKFAELKKSYKELEAIAQKRGEEFLAQFKEKSKEILHLQKELIERNKEFANKIEMLSAKVEEKDAKIGSLTQSNKALEQKGKELDSKIATLQKQVEHPSVKNTENITTFSIGNSKETPNQSLTSKDKQTEVSRPKSGQQKLNKPKGSSKKPEGMNEKTKAEAKTKALDAVSTASTAKSTTSSIKSKLSNTLSNLRGNKNLKDFLSNQNAKLKEGFPEFEGKHFCHNVLGETIKSLSNQSDGKFESNKLLALLKENLVKSGKAIIETKVNKVVEELAKDFVKKHDLKQVIFVERCAEKLYLNEEDSKAIIHSFTGFLANRNDSNNDSVKKFVVQKLTEAEMKCFSNKIQQLASSIRDKFLSPDQGMCVQTSKENNEYELTDKAKKEYTPNSSMSHSNTTNVSKGRFKQSS